MVGAVGLWTARAGAQDVKDLANACAGSQVDVPAWCQDVALTAQAAQGDLALLASGGTSVAGAASTLGKRIGSSPRFSLAGRLTGSEFESPRLGNALEPSTGGASGVGFAAQGTFALGLFQGFSLKPTMGGLLSVDVLATGSLLWAPGSLGFDGTEVAYGIGARLGIFRESFTLPGITLSAVQRWVQGVGVAPTGAAADAGLELGISTTSLRGVVGKDLWGFGWLAGVGWDRSSSDATIPTAAGGEAAFENFANSRALVFAGVSWSYFLLQLSGEVGWASGWGSDWGPASGAYDPASGRIFGGLAIRLIY